jgi:hypothetical protein
MTGRHYVDQAGRSIGRTAWEALSNRAGYGHVALDVVAVRDRTVQVHTFWTGVSRPGTQQPAQPLIFRTCVHGLGLGLPAWGWADITAAAAGHATVLRWVTDHDTTATAPA